MQVAADREKRGGRGEQRAVVKGMSDSEGLMVFAHTRLGGIYIAKGRL